MSEICEFVNIGFMRNWGMDVDGVDRREAVAAVGRDSGCVNLPKW